MTRLYDGQLTDIIQNPSRYNVEVQAISYALQAEKQRLMDLAHRTRTMAMVDELPEAILDVLAVELRTPYYTGDMTIEQKRSVIKGSMVWFYKAGTPAAVSEMAAAVFGSGQVVEWFSFDPNDGEIVPGEFDLETSAEIQDPTEFMPQISRIINRVKNARSHLRSVRFLRIVHSPESAVILPQHYTVTPVSNVLAETKETGPAIGASTFTQATPSVTVRNVLEKLVGIDTGPVLSALAQAFSEVTIQVGA